MIATRGLGPTPSIATAGLGPIIVIPGPPHGGSHSHWGWISTGSGARRSRGGAVTIYGWESTASGARVSRGAASSAWGWISIGTAGRLGPFAGMMRLKDRAAGRIVITVDE